MLNKCKVEQCDKNAVARGYCSAHYANFRRLGTPFPKGKQKSVCTCVGCSREVEGLGLCSKHYQRYKKYGDTGTENLKSEFSGLSKKYPEEYRSWKGAKERCMNPKSRLYKNYGGKGVTFYAGWLGAEGFKTFLRDMGRKPSYAKALSGRALYSLDRIDGTRGYAPGNCRWATLSEQNLNRKSVPYIDFNGDKRAIVEWGRLYGLTRETTYQRFKNGWGLDRLFSN